MNIKIDNKKKYIFNIHIIQIIISIIINIILYSVYKHKIYNVQTFILLLLISNIILFYKNKIIQLTIFLKKIKKEINEIYWSSILDTIQITMLIFITTLITSLVFWLLDRIIFYLISSIINLRF